jgi:hypothetical protein
MSLPPRQTQRVNNEVQCPKSKAQSRRHSPTTSVGRAAHPAVAMREGGSLQAAFRPSAFSVRRSEFDVSPYKKSPSPNACPRMHSKQSQPFRGGIPRLWTLDCGPWTFPSRKSHAINHGCTQSHPIAPNRTQSHPIAPSCSWTTLDFGPWTLDVPYSAFRVPRARSPLDPLARRSKAKAARPFPGLTPNRTKSKRFKPNQTKEVGGVPAVCSRLSLITCHSSHITHR